MTLDQRALFLNNARGAPLRVSWDITALRFIGDIIPLFPFGELELLKDSIEALRMIDTCTMFMLLHDVEFPGLRELRYQQNSFSRGSVPDSGPLKQFMLKAPCLTRLSLQ